MNVNINLKRIGFKEFSNSLIFKYPFNRVTLLSSSLFSILYLILTGMISIVNCPGDQDVIFTLLTKGPLGQGPWLILYLRPIVISINFEAAIVTFVLSLLLD